MTRIITIGTGTGANERDYDTLGEFVADVGVTLPAGPAAETDPWEVHCYNDDGLAIQESGQVDISNLFFSGGVNNSSATYNCTLMPATGLGANDHPNDHRTRSGALDYDPAVGVAFEWSGGHRGLFEYNGSTATAPYINLVGLQFYHSQIDFTREVIRRRRCTASITEQCIFKAFPRVDRGSAEDWNGRIFHFDANDANNIIRNNLIIMSGDSTHRPDTSAIGLGFGSLTSQVYNNTVVNELHATVSDISGAKVGSANANGVFSNNLILGFDTSWDNSGNTVGTQEYTVTDASSANTDGSNNVTGITLANQLDDITLGSLNARLKSGSDAIDAAGGSTIATDDIFDATRDAPEDVGCAEFSRLVGNGLIAGNKLQRGKLVQ